MKLLKSTLVLNATSCLVFGILMTVKSESINVFLENPISWVTPVVGIALIVNGGHLFLAGRRQQLIPFEIIYFIVGDFLWVLISFSLIASGAIIVSMRGIVVSSLIALMVGLFGVLQYFGYKQLRSPCSPGVPKNQCLRS